MSVTLERARTAPSLPPKSSRWAWIVTMASPAFCAVAIWMAFFILGDENIKWWGNVIVTLLVVAPPAVGVALGIRSGRSGNRFGDHASALAAAWIGFMITFWYAANYPYNGESNGMPVSLGVVAAAVVAAAVEAVWYARRRGHLNLR